MTSSVAAMLAQLKNAALARKSFVEMTSSKFRERLGHLLVKESYLKGAHQFKKGNFTYLRLDLPEYGEGRLEWTPLRLMHIISKPGQRIYLSSAAIAKLIDKGRRKIIISTSRGLMSVLEAKKRKMGGEAICELG